MPPRYHLSVRRSAWLLVLGITLITASMGGCECNTPIKIGFVGCLTGRLSDLGVAGRNGVILAVEQINAAGGIQGRPLELLIRDDQHEPDVALRVDQELIDAGVVAIIGHMTSAMTLVTLPLINDARLLMLSPTASTDQLTGIDDYFFRIMPPSTATSASTARYVFQGLGIRRVTCVYDLSNRSYSAGWFRQFKTTFERLGGRLTFVKSFISSNRLSYRDLASQMHTASADGHLIIAGAVDTAMLCQQLKRLGSQHPLIISGWAYTADLLRHGGDAVEGVVLAHSANNNSLRPGYLAFKHQFYTRFGSIPDFAATYGYEAAHVLFSALAQTTEPARLKAVLLQQREFSGLQADIEFDQYGDNQRKPFFITVKNGEFVTLADHDAPQETELK